MPDSLEIIGTARKDGHRRALYALAYGMSIRRVLDMLQIPDQFQLSTWEDEGGAYQQPPPTMDTFYTLLELFPSRYNQRPMSQRTCTITPNNPNRIPPPFCEGDGGSDVNPHHPANTGGKDPLVTRRIRTENLHLVTTSHYTTLRDSTPYESSSSHWYCDQCCPVCSAGKKERILR